MKKEKGALAIEATIAFTVFITFLFMLMAVVKLSLVYITINDITAETAKKIAGMSYPLSYVNEYIDNVLGEVESAFDYQEHEYNIVEMVGDGDTASLLDCLAENSDDFNFTDIESIVSTLKDNIIELALQALVEAKHSLIQNVMANIYLDMVDKSNMPIDKSKIKVSYFTIPQGENEFSLAKDLIMEKTKLGENEFTKDDVILFIQYDYSIIVPFFPKYDVTLSSLAVEKAWLNGGDQLLNAEREGIQVNVNTADNTQVAVATTSGKKYHRITNGVPDCTTLRRSSSIATYTIKSASQAGYTACAVCKPGEPKEE